MSISFKKVICYLVKNGVKYPVHIWTPDRKFGDYTTDAAIVLYKVMHDRR